MKGYDVININIQIMYSLYFQGEGGSQGVLESFIGVDSVGNFLHAAGGGGQAGLCQQSCSVSSFWKYTPGYVYR